MTNTVQVAKKLSQVEEIQALDMLVLLYIKDSERNGLSYEEIETDLKISNRTLIRSIKRLVDAELLEKKRGNNHVKTEFRILVKL